MNSAERITRIKSISKRLSWFLIVLIVIILWFVIWGPQEPWMILIVFGLGALGSLVSLQRRLKSLADDDLVLLSETLLGAWLAPIVGGVLAAVLYCLFISGLLSGELFPDFCEAVNNKYGDPFYNSCLPSTFQRLKECQGNTIADYGKLFFWSFLAGFSEKFVVDIIGQFDKPRSKDEETGSQETHPK